MRETIESAEEARGRPGRRFYGGMLAYVVGIILIITLVPFRFEWPGELRISAMGGLDDALTNVALFLPFGFLHRLFRSSRGDRFGLRALLAGFALSLGIEAAQLFSEIRYSAVGDLLANASGAWIGAQLQQWLHRQMGARSDLPHRFALDLPLMGGVYLLIPLLWLDALTVIEDSTRVFLLLLLGCFGASLLVAIRVNRRHREGIGRDWNLVLAATAWFGVGIAPAALRWPTYLMLASLGLIAGFTWWRLQRHAVPAVTDRRFELRALRGALPFFALYLLLLPGFSLAGEVSAWQFSIGFPESGSYWLRDNIQLLELLAAATLLGYLAIEIRGREELPFAATLPWVLGWVGAWALSVEAIHGVLGSGSSLLRLLLLAGVGAYGGWLYQLFRVYVQAARPRVFLSGMPEIGTAETGSADAGGHERRELTRGDGVRMLSIGPR